jgi:hypothetical protein
MRALTLPLYLEQTCTEKVPSRPVLLRWLELVLAGMASSGSVGGEDDGEAIQVFVRIRPLNKREIAENQTIGWNFNETSMIEDTPNGHKNYTFDRCYGPEENNATVYERVGKNVVIKALEGYNGTVFTCQCSLLSLFLCSFLFRWSNWKWENIYDERK